MDEGLTLSEVIQNAVAEWVAGTDKSMLTNFVFAADFIEDDGSNTTAVITPPNASTSAQLGLAHYAVNLIGEVQRRDVLEQIIYTDEGDDES